MFTLNLAFVFRSRIIKQLYIIGALRLFSAAFKQSLESQLPESKVYVSLYLSLSLSL